MPPAPPPAPLPAPQSPGSGPASEPSAPPTEEVPASDSISAELAPAPAPAPVPPQQPPPPAPVPAQPSVPALTLPLQPYLPLQPSLIMAEVKFLAHQADCQLAKPTGLLMLQSFIGPRGAELARMVMRVATEAVKKQERRRVMPRDIEPLIQLLRLALPTA